MPSPWPSATLPHLFNPLLSPLTPELLYRPQLAAREFTSHPQPPQHHCIDLLFDGFSLTQTSMFLNISRLQQALLAATMHSPCNNSSSGADLMAKTKPIYIPYPSINAEILVKEKCINMIDKYIYILSVYNCYTVHVIHIWDFLNLFIVCSFFSIGS